MSRLDDLALLEEVVQLCRYEKPVRTDELRRVFAALLTPNTKRWLVDLWKALDDDSAHRFGYADDALGWIYRELNIPRDPKVAHAIWDRMYEARLSPHMRKALGG